MQISLYCTYSVLWFTPNRLRSLRSEHCFRKSEIRLSRKLTISANVVCANCWIARISIIFLPSHFALISHRPLSSQSRGPSCSEDADEHARTEADYTKIQGETRIKRVPRAAYLLSARTTMTSEMKEGTREKENRKTEYSRSVKNRNEKDLGQTRRVLWGRVGGFWLMFVRFTDVCR